MIEPMSVIALVASFAAGFCLAGLLRDLRDYLK